MTLPTLFSLSPTPLMWLLGGGVGLIVGLIAFAVASRLLDEQAHGRPAKHRGAPRSDR